MSINISNEQPKSHSYDRKKEAEQFENTKLGVKGLLDSKITRIPRLFHHPPDSLFSYESAISDDTCLIPVIDMSSTSHIDLVDLIRNAASKFGFFQVINHGVPVSLLARLLDAVKAAHEISDEEKMGYYRRNIIRTSNGFGFYSNDNLFQTKAACWRDSISARLGPNMVNPSDIPLVCRNEIVEWGKEVKQLGENLMGLLSEGLGLSNDRLKGMSYLGKVVMVGQYYPYCPEPNKTVGVASHTDLSTLTILLQDLVGGLQVKYDNKWFNLKPVDGALVINIGDVFQILSNGKYKSGEHRVYANPLEKPRVSVATFFKPGVDGEIFGPLDELISAQNPVLYKQVKYLDLVTKFSTSESDRLSIADHFRL